MYLCDLLSRDGFSDARDPWGAMGPEPIPVAPLFEHAESGTDWSQSFNP
jgi:hypothetical protein